MNMLRAPRNLTLEQQQEIIVLAAAGKPISEIQERCGMDAAEFWRYRDGNPTFAKEFAVARLEGCEQLADQLLTVADEYEDVNRGRLKSENLRWILSKRKASVYGDKLDINVTQSVDIAGALAAAKARAMLPARYPEQITDVQAIDITHDKQVATTDCQSVAEPEADIFS